MNDARAKEIFLAAIDRPDAERAAYLDEACAGDAALRAEVEALLAAHAEQPLLGAPNGTISTDMADEEVTRLVHTHVGPYKLLELIGEGGFGAVYVADQEKPVRRRVALKVIKLGMDTRQVIARFEAERQALAMMDHPNIARVLDAGATETGRPWFAMELVRGMPITEYCDSAKLTAAERLELYIHVCHAVQHAHTKGVIHRDLKPSNVLVTLHDGKPVPKVIDFGIAKAVGAQLTDKTVYTLHRQVIGTPAYMAPEQAEMSGLDVDTRADVYSLGVLLYELLTGAPPFSFEELKKAGWVEMQRIIREVEPVKPSTRVGTLGATLPSVAAVRRVEPKKLTLLLRGDLDWISMKCLEKDRTRRYATANELAADVQRHLSGEPVVAAPPSVGYRMKKFVRKHRGQVVATTLITVVLIGGIAATSWQWRRAELAVIEQSRAREDADHQRQRADKERDAANAEKQKAQRLYEQAAEGIARIAKEAGDQSESRESILVPDSAARGITERIQPPHTTQVVGQTNGEKPTEHALSDAIANAISAIRRTQADRDVIFLSLKKKYITKRRLLAAMDQKDTLPLWIREIGRRFGDAWQPSMDELDSLVWSTIINPESEPEQIVGALDVAEEVFQQNPENRHALIMLGAAQFRAKRFARSLESLERARSYERQGQEEQQGDWTIGTCLAIRTMCLNQLGRTEELYKCRKEIRRVEFAIRSRWYTSRNKEVLSLLDEAKHMIGPDPDQLNHTYRDVVVDRASTREQVAQALVTIEAASRREPTNGSLLTTLGIALFRMDATKDAMKTLVQACKLNRHEEPADWAYLAMCQKKLGLIEESEHTLLRLWESLKDGNKLNGQLNGRIMIFRYVESPWMRNSGEGVVEFAQDGKSFSGKLHSDSDASVFDWTGTRITGNALDRFDGLWLTNDDYLWLTSKGNELYGNYGLEPFVAEAILLVALRQSSTTQPAPPGTTFQPMSAPTSQTVTTQSDDEARRGKPEVKAPPTATTQSAAQPVTSENSKEHP